MTNTHEGKVALVTGAGSGNGAAIARWLADEGAEVILLDRNAEGLEKTLADWDSAARSRASSVIADITDSDQVAAAMNNLDRLDILVNNAGVVDGTPFPELDIPEFEKVMNVNVYGAYRCTKAALALLKASSAGRVVNITSMEGHHLLSTGGNVQPHYNASKAALDLLTKGLAYELAPYKITVNAVAPGVIATPFTSGSLANSEISDWIEAQVPLSRLGAPEDIAATVSFLASEGAGFVTGASIPVDGGLTLGWFRRKPAHAGA